EPEKLVAPDRTADRRAKLILFERCLTGVGVLEVVAGVEEGVAKEFEHVAMIGVRAGFYDRVNGRSAAAPELRGKRVCLDFELLDSVHVRAQYHPTVIVRVVVDSIEKEIVQRAAGSVGYKTVLAARAA